MSHPSLEVVDGLATVTLPELVATAALTTRHDAKYVVDRAHLAGLIASLGEGFRVLDTDGARSTRYASAYFDTSDLLTYREHLMGRRRRWKLRTRHYGDPTATTLELKLKSSRGQTVKHRWPHTAAPDVLDTAGWQTASQTLQAAYGTALPDHLEVAVTTAYRRTTLVDTVAGERVTIDEELEIAAGGQRVALGAHVAVVEVKAAGLRGETVRALGQLGLRPDRVSKYCVGVASAYDDVRGNPWIPVLRRMQPEAVAPVG